jgi:hypothetical protein
MLLIIICPAPTFVRMSFDYASKFYLQLTWKYLRKSASKVQVIITWNFLSIWSKNNLELHGIEKATKLMDWRVIVFLKKLSKFFS